MDVFIYLVRNEHFIFVSYTKLQRRIRISGQFMPKFIDFEPASAQTDGILARRQLQASWVTWLTHFFNNGLGGTNFFTLMFLFLATTIPTWRPYTPISFDWGSVTVLAHGTTTHDLLPLADLMFSALLLGNKGYVMFRPPRLTVAKLSFQFFVDASLPLLITGILIISWYLVVTCHFCRIVSRGVLDSLKGRILVTWIPDAVFKPQGELAKASSARPHIKK